MILYVCFVQWPFRRCLGIQEPASVMFSILNGLGHVLGWRKYCAVVPPEYKMHSTWHLNMLVSDSQRILCSAIKF